MDLNTPIGALNRVGKTTTTHLTRLGVSTAGDLLYFFPFRYEDYRKIALVTDLKPGEMATVKVKIELIASKRTSRQRRFITEALLSDINGDSVKAIWFNQPYLSKTLKTGDEIYLSGKVQGDMAGAQFVSPVYEKVHEGETTHTARLVPIYPVTQGLTQKQLRFLVSQVLTLADSSKEWLAENILDKYDLIPLKDALRGIHFPDDDEDLVKSTERLKFDELFILQLRAELARNEMLFEHAPTLEFKKESIQAFVRSLPFTLTQAQKIASWEILKNIADNKPMNRLLSGDVGSGKTVVAAMALFDTALNNYQGVLMAPTEILATQHYHSLCKLFGDRLNIALLTRSQFQISNIQCQINIKLSKSKAKGQIFNAINKGDVQIVVGTHALLSEKVDFKKLGLVIVDEQHRFGVGQRRAIKEKSSFAKASADEGGCKAHFLSMTATPIPRSLALMIYGDLDVSQINEMPAGRKKIITKVVEPAKRVAAYNFIKAQVQAGRQIFVICPLIEETSVISTESDDGGRVEKSLSPALRDSSIAFHSTRNDNVNEKKTVMSEYEKLSKEIFPNLRVGFLHGKLPPKEKDETMNKFKNKEIDILVSTSVVEVGVDIPNATVMMIEDADRFGLAQLHQFRGRVGRSVFQSYCILFTSSASKFVQERLKFFENNPDGFKLAEKDLETRGPGEVYGTLQSGVMNLCLAKLTDVGIIKKAREAARFVAQKIDDFPLISAKIKEIQEAVHLE